MDIRRIFRGWIMALCAAILLCATAFASNGVAIGPVVSAVPSELAAGEETGDGPLLRCALEGQRHTVSTDRRRLKGQPSPLRLDVQVLGRLGTERDSRGL